MQPWPETAVHGAIVRFRHDRPLERSDTKPSIGCHPERAGQWQVASVDNMPGEAMYKVGLEVMVPSPLQVVVDDDRLARHDVKLYLKRDDLIHPDVPGNK